MALKDAGSKARMERSLTEFGSIGIHKGDPDSSLVMQRFPAIFGDIAMGRVRNSTICACVENQRDVEQDARRA